MLIGLVVLLPWSVPSAGQSALASAESSFAYIASSLQTFQRTGRLADNPGIDGADLEFFIDLLETWYGEFRRNFGPASVTCAFYMDPANGRMTIEERAQLSFGMLPDLEARNARYIAVDREFQADVVAHFGSLLLRNINDAKTAARSNQRLPTANFEQSVIINFLDTACGQ